MSSEIVDYKTLYESWAEQLEKLGDFQEAIRLRRRLIELYPSHAPVFAALAATLLRVGELQGARQHAERALELDSENKDVFVIWARVLNSSIAEGVSDGFFDQRITRQLALFPFWAELRRELVTYYIKVKQFDHAILNCDHLVRDAPSLSDWSLCAYVLASGGNLEAAQKLADQLLQHRDHLEINSYILLIKCLVKLGNPNLSLQIANEILQKGLHNEEFFIELSQIFIAMGQQSSALQVLESGMANTSISTGLLKEAALALKEYRVNYEWKKDLSRRVVFVSQNPKVREAKFAEGLRREGWEVVLLHRNSLNANPERYFDGTINYKTTEEAIYRCAGIGAQLFHVFEAASSTTATALIKAKLGKVVFDTVDVFEGMIYHSLDASCAQQFCMEYADALVCRDLQIAASNRLRKRRRRQPVIYYPEYCWGAPLDNAWQDRPEDEIHIVQAGFMNVRKEGIAGQESYYDIFKAFVEAGIHIHVYAQIMMIDPGRYEEEYGDFVGLGADKDLTHLHQSVPFDTLISELSRYDFGLTIIPEVDMPGHYGRFPKTRAHYAYCGSARATDYIDAGLPVISSPPARFQNFILRRYGKYIPFDQALRDDPVGVLKSYKTPALRNQILKNRQAYSISEHSKRLSEFYERIINLGAS